MTELGQFEKDHEECLERYFQTGRKECLVIRAGDGHAEGFDPTMYGGSWKKSFAKLFTKESVKYKFVWNEQNWEHEFIEYLKRKNSIPEFKSLAVTRPGLKGSLPEFNPTKDVHPSLLQASQSAPASSSTAQQVATNPSLEIDAASVERLPTQRDPDLRGQGSTAENGNKVPIDSKPKGKPIGHQRQVATQERANYGAVGKAGVSEKEKVREQKLLQTQIELAAKAFLEKSMSSYDVENMSSEQIKEAIQEMTDVKEAFIKYNPKPVDSKSPKTLLKQPATANQTVLGIDSKLKNDRFNEKTVRFSENDNSNTMDALTYAPGNKSRINETFSYEKLSKKPEKVLERPVSSRNDSNQEILKKFQQAKIDSKNYLSAAGSGKAKVDHRYDNFASQKPSISIASFNQLTTGMPPCSEENIRAPNSTAGLEARLMEQIRALSAKVESLTIKQDAQSLNVESQSTIVKKARAQDVYYRIDPDTNEETNELIEEHDNSNKIFMSEAETDLFLYVEEIHTVHQSQFKDKSLAKKTELLEKKHLKEWNSDLCKSIIQQLYVEYHSIAQKCNFCCYTIAYFIPHNFMHGKKREQVRNVIRQNCREYVQSERILSAVKKGQIELGPERLREFQKSVLTEYNLKNILYFCIAEAVQPNFKSLGYPPWQVSKGEDLTDFYAKILAIYKMKTSTNRNGIRASEKREALEEMIKTLYKDGNHEIVTWINNSEKLDFFRSGHTKDLALKEIDKCLNAAQVRRAQEVDSVKIRNQYCTIKTENTNTSSMVPNVSSFDGQDIEEFEDLDDLLDSGSHETIANFARKVFQSQFRRNNFQNRQKEFRKPWSRGFQAPRESYGEKTDYSKNRLMNDVSQGRSKGFRPKDDFRTQKYRDLNRKYPDTRRGYNRNSQDKKFHRFNLFRNSFKDRVHKQLNHLWKSMDAHEDDLEKYLEDVNVSYEVNEIHPEVLRPETIEEQEEREVAEVNLTSFLKDKPKEYDCYLMPERRSDLIYANVRFDTNPAKSIRCLLDTGSSVNLIRYDTLSLIEAKGDMKPVKSPTTVYGFNDAQTVIDREIRLKCIVGPKTFDLTFYVIPANVMKTQNAILGRPALEKLGIWVLLTEFCQKRLNQ